MSPRPALAAALLCACTTVSQAPAPGAPKAQQPAPLPGEQEKPKPAQAPPPAPATPAAPGERPLHELPYTPSLDPAAMDRSADPCVDFYQYSCGGWLKNNPIPADQARWSVYGKLAQDNRRYLWGILEDLSKRQDGRSASQQKIGDYFGACMDE